MKSRVNFVFQLRLFAICSVVCGPFCRSRSVGGDGGVRLLSLLMVEVGVGERRGETERNVLPTYDGCVSVTGGAPRCLGTATTGRGVWGGEQCLPVSNLLFMLVAGWRRAGPSPSFLAVTAAQPGQCVTKLLPTPTATVAGELCARELNDSSGVGLE